MPTLTHVYDAAWSGDPSNPGAFLTITGTEIIDGLTQSGHIIVDASGGSNTTFASSYNIVAGVSNIALGTNFVIVSDSTTAGVVGRTTGGGTTPDEPADTPTYWISNGSTPDDFLNLVNALPPSLEGNGFNTPLTKPPGGRPYFDGSTAGIGDAAAAKTWLNNNGYWTSYP